MQKAFIFLMAFFCSFLLADAQDFYHQQKITPGEIFELTKREGTFYITEYIEYFQDSSCQYDIYSVSDSSFSSKFISYQKIPLTNSNHRVLKANGCHWAKIKINNHLTYDAEWFLLLGTGSIIEAYFLEKGNEYTVKKTGEFVKASDRNVPIERGNKVLIMLPAKQEEITLFVKLQSSVNMNNYFNIALKSPNEWHAFIYERNLIQGFFQGIVWIMMLYSLAIFAFIRDKTYLYYALYLLTLSILFYHYHSFNLIPVLNEVPYLGLYLSFISSNLITVLYFQFLRHFLQLELHLPKWNKFIIRWMAFRVVFLLVGCFFISTSYAVGFPYENSEIIFGIESIINFFIFFAIYRKGSQMAKFFIVGTIALYFGVFLAALGWSNYLIPLGIGGAESGYFIQIGVVIEILIFSLGLGYNIKNNETEKQQYQEKLILQLRQNELLQASITHELEFKVKERTKEIEAQKTEILNKSKDLKKANKEISAQKETVENAFKKLKAAQESLVRSEKMASLGQLTAGIAHEINNPINFVTSNISPLKTDFSELKTLLDAYMQLSIGNNDLHDDLKNAHKQSEEFDAPYLLKEIEDLLNGIEIGANRTKEIVAGLKSFSRLNEDTIKLTDVHEGINNTLLLLNNKIKQRIHIEKNYGEKVPLIECYPGQLNQVFMNILDNAISAIQEKGMISITTDIKVHQKQQYVSIQFKDNGTGMNEDIQQHIFEPFFTTKSVGKGSGLGLSISYGIIKQHKGQIFVESKEGDGSMFTILLPLEQHSST